MTAENTLMSLVSHYSAIVSLVSHATFAGTEVRDEQS